jgi:hypothetical protein
MASMFQTTLAVKTPPKGEPVSIVLARQHCRIDNSSDDALLAMYLTTARQMAEQYLSRALLTGGRDLRCTELESVQVEFTAGYADVDDIPKAIINAILLTTGFLYENRGDVAAEMPRAAEWLLDAYRIMFVG